MSANGSVAKSTDTIQGFTKEGLAEFNAQFHSLVNNGELANVVTLIARHGEIVNCDAYGVLDISTTPPVPVRTDSIFRIASMTKPLEPGVRLRLYRRDINGLGFGLGYAIVRDPAAAKTSQGIQSYFWGGLFGTTFWIDPINDMIVIGFTNNTNGLTLAGAMGVRELSARLIYRAVNESSGN